MIKSYFIIETHYCLIAKILYFKVQKEHLSHHYNIVRNVIQKYVFPMISFIQTCHIPESLSPRDASIYVVNSIKSCTLSCSGRLLSIGLSADPAVKRLFNELLSIFLRWLKAVFTTLINNVSSQGNVST